VLSTSPNVSEGIDGIEFCFNFFKGCPGIGHDEVGACPEFFNNLVSPAVDPSSLSGCTVKFFIYLAVGFPDKDLVVKQRTFLTFGT